MHGRLGGEDAHGPAGGGAAADAEQPALPAGHRAGHVPPLLRRGARLLLHHVHVDCEYMR